MTQVVRSRIGFLLMLPVVLAAPGEQGSAITVVLLFLLLMVLCIALVLAWKKLVQTEGGEIYHPLELWQSTQEVVQSVKNRWTHEDQERSTVEDEEDCQGEEPDITAL